ncbi:radical SAM protein [Candidatus Woesearchaeota archaeon]|nr:radical SAM protein [Candidatus Woesearchaeota archaeon]
MQPISSFDRKSICPKCFKKIDSRFVTKNNSIFLEKICPKHGKFKVKVSSDAAYFNELLKINMPKPRLRSPELVVMPITHACNLHCPICYVDTHAQVDKIPLTQIMQYIDELEKKKVQRINIFGGEPTVRPDLSKIISYVSSRGILPVLFTNGLKLTDISYLKELKKAGLARVFLQFDGFKKSAYKKLRGKEIVEHKMQALQNLRRLCIPTVLEVTVGAGINEDQIYPIIKYAVKHRFIKAASFRSYSYLGSKLDQKHSIDAQKMIHILEKDSANDKKVIKMSDVLEFQKFFLKFSAAGGQPNCIYMNFFAVDRKLNPITNYFDFRSYNKYYEKKNQNNEPPYKNSIKSLLSLTRLFKFSAIPFYLKIAASLPKLLERTQLEDINDEILPITFETQCDSYSYDIDIAKHCRGHDMINGKIMLTGEANIEREQKNCRSN